jgi:hypothetical protein
MNRHYHSDPHDGADDFDAALYDPQLDHRPSDRTTDHRLGPMPGEPETPPGLLFPSPFAADANIDYAAIAALVAQLAPEDDLALARRTICTELFDGTQEPAELQAAVDAELQRRFGM